MTESKSVELKFSSVAWPIFVDNFLRILAMLASYGVVSRISDDIAAVVGVTNLYLLIGFSFVECLAQGGSIIFTQYLGARKSSEVADAYTITIWANSCFGLLLSLFFFCFCDTLLSMYQFSDYLLGEGAYYLRLIGSGFTIYSVNYVFLYILNANGLTKHSMIYSLLVNFSSMILYYFIATLPDSFSFDCLTLIGSAHLLVRLVGLIFLLTILKKRVHNFALYRPIAKKTLCSYLRKLFRVGIPNTVEPLIRQIFQFTMLQMISFIGIEAISVRSYITPLAALFEVGSTSVARSNQILLGYLIGAKQPIEKIHLQLKKGVIVSFYITLAIVIFALHYRYSLMHFFSEDEYIIETGSQLLFFVAILTIVRALSLNVYAGLKAAGDLGFGVLLTLISMWSIVLPGSYAATYIFDLGLKGIWSVFIFDELFRSYFLGLRWKNEKWKECCFIR